MIPTVFVEKHIEQQRRSICMQCEHKLAIGVCSKCGCVIAGKVKIALTQCPIGKWSKQSND